MYSEDYFKIYNQNIEVANVLHKNLSVWSSFDGDFSNPELWEPGGIGTIAGDNVGSSSNARTKKFYKIPSSRLSVTKNSEYNGNLFFYRKDNSFIGYQMFSTSMTVPNDATYYKVAFFKSRVPPMNIPVFVPEANIKVEGV